MENFKGTKTLLLFSNSTEMLYYSLAADVCVPSVRTSKRKLLFSFQLADEMLPIGLTSYVINYLHMY